jgi:death on curing protein
LILVVLALHEVQLAEHGGQPGLRDEGLLDSALARPKNQFHYGNTHLAALAASYAHGLAKNHPFLDGNKRVSLAASATFLLFNGYVLTASQAELVRIWLSLADGTMTEEDLTQWFKDNSKQGL